MTHNTDITPTKVQQDSKLGDIPMDWKVVAFGDISDKKIKWSITGGPFGSDLKSEHYTDSGVRVIQLQNIGDGTFNQDYKIYTSEEKADQLIACNIFPGEIILSKMGDPVARACFIPNGEDRYLMGSDGIRLVVNKETFDSKFVLEYINYSIFRNLAIRHSTGSTRSRIGLTDLKKLPFICPPLPEQQKIAQILATWDVAINKQEALITQKQEQKKGLMQQLLTGKKRFAGFTDEWEEIRLKDVGKVYTGGTPSTNIDDYWNGTITWYTPTEITKAGKYVSDSKRKITEIGLAESSAQLFPKNTIVVCTRATIGELSISEKPATTNQGFKSICPNKNHCTEFIYYKLSVEKKRFISKSSGSTFLELSTTDFKNFKILVPSLKEQQKIAEVLTAADNEITALKQQLQQLKTQKQGLMQQLLTGKISVKN